MKDAAHAAIRFRGGSAGIYYQKIITIFLNLSSLEFLFLSLTIIGASFASVPDVSHDRGGSSGVFASVDLGSHTAVSNNAIDAAANAFGSIYLI